MYHVLYTWKLLCPAPEAELFHSDKAPRATLFERFDGTLDEGAIDQPRFIGGDAIAKQKGLVGECVAIAAHLARQPAAAAQVARAVDQLVDRELAEGTARPGPAFWSRPMEALRAVGA